MTKVGFAEAYYDSLTGAQQSMLPLVTESDGIDSTVLLPRAGDLSGNLDERGVRRVVLPYPDRLDKFNKQHLEAPFHTKLLNSVVLARYHLKVLAHYRSAEYDVVYCNNNRAMVLYGPPAKLLGIPVVSYVRDDTPMGWVDKLRLRIADHVVLISDATKSRFEPRDREKFAHKFETINTGVDTDEFDPTDYETDDDGPVQITEVATIQERKGQDVLVEAISRIDDDVPEYDVNLAGNVPPGAESYEAEVRSTCREYDIEDDVSFLGWVDDVPRLLSETDVFVLPSYNEGLPRSLLEAGAMRLPLVATPAGGADEIVRDGETGFLVPFDDPAATAESLEKLVRDPDLRAEMGAAARETVLEEFSQKRYVEEFEAFVSETVASQGR